LGIKPINVVITGFDRASNVFGNLSKRADTFGKRIEKIGGVSKKLGMGGLGLGVGGVFATGLSDLPAQLIAVEESAARLAFTEKFTAEESLKVGKAVKRLSRETLQSQLDLNGAIDKIGDAGFTLDETLSILPAAAKQATALGKPLETTADLAFSLGSQFKIAAGEMGGAIDMVTELASSNFELDELASVIPRIGQASKSLNLNGKAGLAEFAAGLEVIRGETRDSGAAAKGFAKLMEGVFDSGTLEKFRKGGVNGPGVDVMAEMRKAAKGGGSQLEAYLKLVKRVTDSSDKGTREARIKDLFGDADATAIRAILDNMDKYRESVAKFQKSAGSTETGFQKQLEVTSGQWKKLRQTVLSSDFKPVARGITLLNNALKWINEGDGERAEMVLYGITGAVAVGGGLVAIGSLAGALKDISIVMGTISKGGPLAIKMIQGLSTAANPIPIPSNLPGSVPTPGGAGGLGKTGLALGALALPAFMAYGAYHAFQEGKAEGERQFAENNAGRKLTQVNTGFGGWMPVYSSVKSNPDAVRAAAGIGTHAPARVEGEVVIRLENAPPGTKIATKSNGVDFRPETGMSR
jgi:TP901 family phage tail tape measure protein